MNPPRAHHLSTPTIDILPCDIAVEPVGGLVDIYADTNTLSWHRLRLTADQAIALYYRLAECLPLRMPAEEMIP